VLPFIPLMQGGGESAIIARWKELAQAEPDRRRRGDYGGLALVFAEAAGRRDVWKQALEGWNVIESQQVNEWIAVGRAEGEARGRAEGEARGQLVGCRADLRVMLEDRFGALPEGLIQRIETEEDLGRLQTALRQVYRVATLEELRL
jgi:hypothetical protein